MFHISVERLINQQRKTSQEVYIKHLRETLATIKIRQESNRGYLEEDGAHCNTDL